MTALPVLALSRIALVTSLGAGLERNLTALREGRSGLAPCGFMPLPFATYAGEVPGLDAPLSDADPGFDCRNNRLAALALAQDGFREAVAAARTRYGPARIGVFAGTSTSGLLQTEAAYRARDAATGALPLDLDYARTHNTYALARYLRQTLALEGPAFVVSTACAATSKVFGNAQRMIAAGLCDAAVVGGADTLCATTLFGFHALGVMAEEPCRPFGAARRGISIGEAAGFVLLERAEAAPEADIRLLGVGESSDAYHMSSPHPEGLGAKRAMAAALAAGGVAPDEVGYVNLHGTATPSGDAAEDRAVVELFGRRTPCNSTKGATGHTLGASGVVEAAFAALALREGLIPGSPHTGQVDPSFGCNYVTGGGTARLDRVLSNSFGFGGVNCSVLLGTA